MGREYDVKVWREFVDRYRVIVDLQWNRYWRLKISNLWILHHMNNERMEMMNAVNPKYILRNHLLQNAIDSAEIGDYAEIERLRTMIEDPFVDNKEFDGVYDQPVPEQTCDSFGNCNLLSCSS